MFRFFDTSFEASVSNVTSLVIDDIIFIFGSTILLTKSLIALYVVAKQWAFLC